MGKIKTSSSKTFFKSLPINEQEKEVATTILRNYRVGGAIYVKDIRAKLRNLEASQMWNLYYSFLRSIKYAMSLLEEPNEQWPLK